MWPTDRGSVLALRYAWVLARCEEERTVARPIRELDDAAKLYRELAKDATQANKFKIAKALMQIGLAKLNDKRTRIIHKNDDVPYDPLTDPEPEGGDPNCPFNRPTSEERRKWEAWEARQDAYYSAHPEVPRP
jgi:hypothetical protein